ncbi:hypothetical protein HMPREF9946_02212 [Acetobacteraceae bacterium AT-5844]|nr:hypothetical protein HMPREF9946_02212 [Acetobacteraceae bacterium AT-5844]
MFLDFYRQLRREKRAVDEANGKYRAARKRAEAAGVDLKSLALMESLSKLDEAEATTRLRTALRYAGWADMKIGEQTDLFAADGQAVPEKAQAEWREGVAEEAGYDAGKSGQNRDDNPYPLGTPHAAAWDRGWCAGQAVIAAEMGPDGTGPKKKRGRKGRGAEMGPQE